MSRSTRKTSVGIHEASNIVTHIEVAAEAAYASFSQASLVELPRVEILDLGHRERLADLGHPFSQVLSPTRAMRSILVQWVGGELDVVPEGVQVPAVKVVELREQPDLVVAGNGRIDQRNEGLVVFVV